MHRDFGPSSRDIVRKGALPRPNRTRSATSLNITKEQLEGAPRYPADQDFDWSAESGRRVYDYDGISALLGVIPADPQPAPTDCSGVLFATNRTNPVVKSFFYDR